MPSSTEYPRPETWRDSPDFDMLAAEVGDPFTVHLSPQSFPAEPPTQEIPIVIAPELCGYTYSTPDGTEITCALPKGHPPVHP